MSEQKMEWTQEQRKVAAEHLYESIWGVGSECDPPMWREARIEKMLEPWKLNPNQHVHVSKIIDLQCEINQLRAATTPEAAPLENQVERPELVKLRRSLAEYKRAIEYMSAYNGRTVYECLEMAREDLGPEPAAVPAHPKGTPEAAGRGDEDFYDLAAAVGLTPRGAEDAVAKYRQKSASPSGELDETQKWEAVILGDKHISDTHGGL